MLFMDNSAKIILQPQSIAITWASGVLTSTNAAFASEVQPALTRTLARTAKANAVDRPLSIVWACVTAQRSLILAQENALVRLN